MIRVGSKVKAKPDLNPVQIFSLISQGIKLDQTYLVADMQEYLGRDYIKIDDLKHWQTADWFNLIEKANCNFIINLDF